ncbi:MAG: SPFH domain-containing protein [Oligoflexia bacterium]|nr:SPFH domain-containing protein [Oligoflexia bacterium]
MVSQVCYRNLRVAVPEFGRSSAQAPRGPIFALRLISESGGILSGFLPLLSLALLIGVGLYFFGAVVPPGMMGVRQVMVGPAQGFGDRGLKPGYHIVIPSYSTIHLVPVTLQLFNMQRRSEEGLEGVGPLEIQTADRAIIDVDLSVVSRFFDQPAEVGEAHGGPAELLTNIGLSADRWNNHIRRTVDDQLKRTLGRLSTSDFYDPDKREEQVKEALDHANKILTRDGILLEAILLRRFTYQAERIDNAIFQKNLQVQEERLNEAASDLAKAQADLEQAAAEADAQIQTKLVEGENQAKVIRSEGELYEAKKKAEADLLVAKAKAEVDRQRAGALAQAAGAQIFVAREMAPLLSTLKGGIVSDPDPFDMQRWIKRLGVDRK